MKFTRKVLCRLAVFIAQVTAGCSIIFPQQTHYNSYLVPIAMVEKGGLYRTEEDGSISYAVEGLRVNVKFMTDAELNTLLPEDSNKGEYSTNPYTYGDYVDRDLGYIPNRFTVFKVSVFNYTFAKVQLDPIEAGLLTDRGEEFHAYGIPSTSPYNSFERYYRGLRGQSGNDFYRFEVRMGHVRSHNYAQDQPIFKGENYSGFIAFDPLEPEVQKVRLEMRDFVLKFDEFGTPIETIDVRFDFDRKIEKWVMREAEKR